MSPKRPDTYSPWKFIEFVYEHRDLFAVRTVTRERDPNTGFWSTHVHIRKFSELPPREFAYWAERWFMDPTTPIRTVEDWARWQEQADATPPHEQF